MIILSPPPKVLLRRPRPKTSLGALSFVGVTPRLCAASILALFAAGTPPPVLASPDGEVCSELGERTTRPIRPTSLPVWRILAPLVPLRFRRRPPLCLPPPVLAAGGGGSKVWKESSLPSAGQSTLPAFRRRKRASRRVQAAMAPVESWRHTARPPPPGARTLWVGDLEDWMDGGRPIRMSALCATRASHCPLRAVSRTHAYHPPRPRRDVDVAHFRVWRNGDECQGEAGRGHGAVSRLRFRGISYHL